jgi:hypothetical protein
MSKKAAKGIVRTPMPTNPPQFADLVKAQLNVGWKAGVAAAIHRISTGRTINNFGHVPEVVRALEWVIEELRDMKPPEEIAND